jgi:Tfp pilus assembly protein PilF
MINKKNYSEAKSLFEKILEMDPDNIDALNSIATCIKHLAAPGEDFFEACL